MRLWHQELIAKLHRQQLLGSTENVAPFVARDGNASMLRLTMFLIIHRTACLSTMSSLCKK